MYRFSNNLAVWKNTYLLSLVCSFLNLGLLSVYTICFATWSGVSTDVSCRDHELWPLTLTFEFDLDKSQTHLKLRPYGAIQICLLLFIFIIKMNQPAKRIGWCSCISTVIAYTDSRTRPNALPGQLKLNIFFWKMKGCFKRYDLTLWLQLAWADNRLGLTGCASLMCTAHGRLSLTNRNSKYVVGSALQYIHYPV